MSGLKNESCGTANRNHLNEIIVCIVSFLFNVILHSNARSIPLINYGISSQFSLKGRFNNHLSLYSFRR